MLPLLFAQQDSNGPSPILVLFEIVFAVITIVGMWKTFTKADKPGWAIFVPIYNIIVLLEIAEMPLWWLILFFVPIANVVAGIMVAIAVAQHFNKGAGFGIGLALLPAIFYAILGFDDSRYNGATGPRL